jgi:DNA-binding CsgD family transcriptional regulator
MLETTRIIPLRPEFEGWRSHAPIERRGLVPGHTAVDARVGAGAPVPTVRGANRDEASWLIDLVAQPAMLVDGARRILIRNRDASRLLIAGEYVVERADRLACRSTSCDAALGDALADLLSDDPGRGPAVRSLLRVHEPGLFMPMMLELLRVTPRPAQPRPDIHAIALLVCHDLRTTRPIDAALLVDLFGLTPSEARVASLLAQGDAPKDIAGSLRVTLSTIRTHIAAVFAKLGVRRQADVVRLLANLPKSPRS